jgi:hypothetical protein
MGGDEMPDLGREELRAQRRYELTPWIAGRVSDPVVDERHCDAPPGGACDANEEPGDRQADRTQKDPPDELVNDCAQ